MASREDSLTSWANIPCPGCGCVCDDVSLTFRGRELVDFKPHCPLGERWFRVHGQAAHSIAKIDGQPASFTDAIEHAASLLRQSDYPLIYGLSRAYAGPACSGRACRATWRGHRHDRVALPWAVDHGAAGSGGSYLHAGGNPQPGRRHCLLGMQSRPIASAGMPSDTRAWPKVDFIRRGEASGPSSWLAMRGTSTIGGWI